MNVTHGHLDVGVASLFAQSWEIDPGHGHARKSGMAQIVDAEGWMDMGFSKGVQLSIAEPVDRPFRIVPGGEEPVGLGFNHSARQDYSSAFDEWDSTPGERRLACWDTKES